jgi:hypothetical protein
MIDLVAPLELAVSATVIVATLAWIFGRRLRDRAVIVAGFGVWFVAVVAAGATGLLQPDRLGVPALGANIVASIAVMLALTLGTRTGRERLLAAPVPALVAMHVVRLLGVSFLVLEAQGRLSAPFAPSAGWGDIATALLALPVAWLVARGVRRARLALIGWNVLGTLDLVVAVGLGATSAPGPLRHFFGVPGTEIMTTLPWMLVPCFVVPTLLATHFALFWRLWRDQAGRLVAVIPRGVAAA